MVKFQNFRYVYDLLRVWIMGIFSKFKKNLLKSFGEIFLLLNLPQIKSWETKASIKNFYY